MTCTIGRPGLDNPGFQWFSNLHCKSGALRVVLERMRAPHGANNFDKFCTVGKNESHLTVHPDCLSLTCAISLQ